jgi:hypothetical protein
MPCPDKVPRHPPFTVQEARVVEALDELEDDHAGPLCDRKRRRSSKRTLIDPNELLRRALPHEEHDLAIAAANAHVLSFDNVSNLPAWLSDALCRLSTGGGNSLCAYKRNDNT